LPSDKAVIPSAWRVHPDGYALEETRGLLDAEGLPFREGIVRGTIHLHELLELRLTEERLEMCSIDALGRRLHLGEE